MCDDNDNPFLTVEETAKLLRVKRRTLDNLRWKGEGPPWRRHGGRIVYHRDEVLAWSEQRRAGTTALPQKTVPKSNGSAWSQSGPAYQSRANPPPTFDMERKP